jgi:predicted KAP-like P-loop ATPase
VVNVINQIGWKIVISSDRPIEQPADDRFGFAAYAEFVARPLLRMDGPNSLVVGIEGPWGYGKTSLLNLVQFTVEAAKAGAPEAERPIFVRFNPWWIAGAQDLTAAFFREVAVPLDQALRKAESLGDKLRTLGARAGKALPILGSIAEAASLGLAPGLAGALGAVGSVLSPEDTLDAAV